MVIYMNETELQQLMNKYEPLVYTVVRGVLTNPRDCEEAVADVFVSLWRSDFDDSAPGAKSYVITVARRRAVDKLRSMGEAGSELPLDEEPTTPGIDDDVYNRINSQIIADVIRSLPSPDGEIFTRRYYYCHRVKEIARDLGLKPSYVKDRLTRAKEEIAKRLLARGINL